MATLNNCGTNSGYQTHYKRKEEACQPCKDAKKEYRKAQYIKNKDREHELHMAWKINNPDLMKSYRDSWSAAHPEKVKEARSAWLLAHPDYNRIKEHRRRARKHASNWSKYTEKKVLETYGSVCHICNEDIDLNLPRRTNQQGWEMGLHIDHLVSLMAGGDDCLDNVRPSHGICNTQKGAKVLTFSDNPL